MSKKSPKSKDATLVATFISKDDVARLDSIIKKYGIKSRYQIIKTIIEAFLKVADPRPDEVVNNDIEEMFEGMEMPSNVDFQDTKRGGCDITASFSIFSFFSLIFTLKELN